MRGGFRFLFSRKSVFLGHPNVPVVLLTDICLPLIPKEPLKSCPAQRQDHGIEELGRAVVGVVVVAALRDRSVAQVEGLYG